MNFISAMRAAYHENKEIRGNINSLYYYLYRPSKTFCIRVRPYCMNPETKRKTESEYSGKSWFGYYEWGLHINQEDVLAEDWIVSPEEIR